MDTLLNEINIKQKELDILKNAQEQINALKTNKVSVNENIFQGKRNDLLPTVPETHLQRVNELELFKNMEIESIAHTFNFVLIIIGFLIKTHPTKHSLFTIFEKSGVSQLPDITIFQVEGLLLNLLGKELIEHNTELSGNALYSLNINKSYLNKEPHQNKTVKNLIGTPAFKFDKIIDACIYILKDISESEKTLVKHLTAEKIFEELKRCKSENVLFLSKPFNMKTVNTSLRVYLSRVNKPLIKYVTKDGEITYEYNTDSSKVESNVTNNISKKKTNLVSMASKILYIFENNKDVYMDLHIFKDKFNLEFPDERMDSNKASILLSNFYLSNYKKKDSHLIRDVISKRFHYAYVG